MRDEVFGQGYADQYDLLYGQKDYGLECDIIEEIFKRQAGGEVRTVLDLGCGTGGHALLLAERGYRVVGVDRSEEMLKIARQKSRDKYEADHDGRIEFIQGDVRTVELDRDFDAVIMMFAVLGYQIDNRDVSNALQTVRKHLKPEGLFIGDVWYGPAVLSIGPSDRIKVLELEDGQLIRAASGELDTRRHLCRVNYRVWRLRQDRVADHFDEEHTMRYFFPRELENFMEQSGLSLKLLCPFMDLDGEAGPETWNILVCAEGT